jgi:hypothetical protein
MTKVFTAQHPTEAHLVAGLLASQGIGAEVQNEALFNVRGEVPVTPATLPTVWVVNDQDASSALEILRDYEPGHPATSSAGASEVAWTCPSCGEQVEAQFEACWNCNTPRPSEP